MRSGQGKGKKEKILKQENFRRKEIMRQSLKLGDGTTAKKKLTQQRRDPRWDEVSGNVPTGKAVGAGLWKL